MGFMNLNERAKGFSLVSKSNQILVPKNYDRLLSSSNIHWFTMLK
jgi:hypothetical protein